MCGSAYLTITLLLKGVILAQLVNTLFTGAFYDGGGDTHHPFFHLAIGARVEYSAIGVEAYHSATVIRGVRDLYVLRGVGSAALDRLRFRAGLGICRWNKWVGNGTEKESEGAIGSLGVGYVLEPAVIEIRWEHFFDESSPIPNGLLITLGLRFG